MKKLIPIVIIAVAVVAIATVVLAHGPRRYRAGAACPYAGLTRDQKFAAFDADHDRYLSPSEYRGPARAFSRVDGNADGLISWSEWTVCPSQWTCCASPHHQHARARAHMRRGCCCR